MPKYRDARVQVWKAWKTFERVSQAWQIEATQSQHDYLSWQLQLFPFAYLSFDVCDVVFDPNAAIWNPQHPENDKRR